MIVDPQSAEDALSSTRICSAEPTSPLTVGILSFLSNASILGFLVFNLNETDLFRLAAGPVRRTIPASLVLVQNFIRLHQNGSHLPALPTIFLSLFGRSSRHNNWTTVKA